MSNRLGLSTLQRSLEQNCGLPTQPFALVEDGTGRAIIFAADGSTAVRTMDGAVKPVSALAAEEIVTPDDLRAFRVASINELSALLQEASAAPK